MRLEQQKRKAEVLALFERDREAVLSSIEQLIEQGKYPQAHVKSAQFLRFFRDKRIKLADQAKQMPLYEQAKKAPASNLSRNIEIDTKLTELNPDNPAYKKQHDLYSQRIEAEGTVNLTEIDPDFRLGRV